LSLAGLVADAREAVMRELCLQAQLHADCIPL